LIVNADDFGDPRFNGSIAAGFAAGFLSSTSVLVTAAGAAEAADHIRRDGLPAGLHINLTTGLPVAAVSEVGSLLGEGGLFLGPEAFRDRLARGLVVGEEIRIECQAQLERFVTLVGDAPTHVDGHHHIHCEAAIAEVLAPLLREWSVWAIRRPALAERHFVHLDRERRHRAGHLQVSIRRTTPIYEKEGCRWPSRFIGIGLGWEHCSLGSIRREIRELPSGCLAEYMVHVLRRGSVSRRDPAFGRHHEFSALSDLRFGAMLEEEDVELVSFEAVAGSTEMVGARE
ncbi:MAG TPA: ChbG/HpnK family deacetylase, partial [Thermoanaerobaculia bacterium]|nr:ChbG/HpnK family deacetylase [Thermoanaerobaculia bacterium]